MKTAQIRQRFLEFFEEHGHSRVASSSLVPANDPTLLFTNAGMVQFKDLFLGNEKADYVRATTSQRCVRAGGKHNDLENVGYTARHHTFFEMLGNFSFGDYFKREAIQFAWSFLTEELKLPEKKLWITVFDQDSDAEDIWLNEIGVSESRLSRIGEKDNFWAMGDVGPCGPCSEIFYDHGEQIEGGPPGTPEEDGDRYIEIWNLVFMQYDRSADGTLTPLPKPSVDTGMGLERIAAVLQHVNNNYDIDLFANLIKEIGLVINTKDLSHHSVRVIADHIRSCSFMIADGVQPSNEGRGYVLRRIIRRAIRHGYQLGGQTPFFYKLVAPLAIEMGQAYPELIEHQAQIEKALRKEELRFAETLEHGLKIFEQKTQNLNSDVVPGDVVFLLYDTYGFPADLTADVARERNLKVDQAGFDEHMQAQRQRARSSSQFANNDEISISTKQATDFVGYNHLSSKAKVLALQSDGNDSVVVKTGKSMAVVLDVTPFYAEGGGQIGDQGLIESKNTRLSVSACKKTVSGAFVHYAEVQQGEIKVGDKVTVSVDAESRYATAANHSATHLMHAVLKTVLGEHVNQKGSLVDTQRLRFDFSHDAPVTKEQLQTIENLVNQHVFSKHVVQSEIMPIDQAKAAGAQALFGEKYGAEVRVVSMSDFSLELCGGTHVSNTSEIGLFKITSESGVASGVRRIEAVTRRQAMQWAESQNDLINQLSTSLKVEPERLLARVEQLQLNVKSLAKEKKKLQQMLSSGGDVQDIESQIKQLGDISLLVSKMDNIDQELLRSTIDQFKHKHKRGVIVLGAEIDGKAKLFAGVSKAIAPSVHAGKLIQHITSISNGRGGGRPDMAEGGVPTTTDIATSLAEVESWLKTIK